MSYRSNIKVSPMDVREVLICPCSSRSRLEYEAGCYTCKGIDCVHSSEASGFRTKADVPIIISELKCDTVCSGEPGKVYVKRRGSRWSLSSLMRAKGSLTTRKNCLRFVRELAGVSARPNVLVIGSGERGAGTDALWTNRDIDIIGVDIYHSETVDVICDAHYLPFPEGLFDGVWIQAVLEHVVQPEVVVSEIQRVLKPDGVVYAETPFMQHVHEGPYDFTRYTVLGHRYLFKAFAAIEFGGDKGADVVLAWSARYFVWAITRSRTAGRLVGAAFSLALKPLRPFLSRRSLYDSSSGVYFLGRKSHDGALTHRELISLYKGQFS